MKLKPELLVEDDARLPDAFSKWFEDRATRSLKERGRLSLCVPGGSVARRLLPALARAKLDWNRVQVFFGDERAVPLSHAESNFDLVRRVLFSKIPLPQTNIHPMRADKEPLSASCDEYERALPETLDLALLGVGTDGHTCSLFPGHELSDPTRAVAVVRDSPKPPATRMTLTYRTLARTRVVAVLALGAEKSSILSRALVDPALPVHRVLRDAREAWLIVDRTAAKGLQAHD